MQKNKEPKQYASVAKVLAEEAQKDLQFLEFSADLNQTPARIGAFHRDVTDKNHPNYKPIDLEVLFKVCLFLPTMDEIAAFFDMRMETFNIRCKEEPEIVDTVKKGFQMARLSLRRAQIRQAMMGDTKMLIFLGKQPDWLGQTDGKDKNDQPLNVETIKQGLLEAWKEAKSIVDNQKVSEREPTGEPLNNKLIERSEIQSTILSEEQRNA